MSHGEQRGVRNGKMSVSGKRYAGEAFSHEVVDVDLVIEKMAFKTLHLALDSL